MKKKMLVWNLLYYLLSPLLYLALSYLGTLCLELFGWDHDLGTLQLAIYAEQFLAVPILVAVLMRFSLLKWYVDPFAAAVAPLFLYASRVFGLAKHMGDFRSAALTVNEALCAGGGVGWLFFAGLFLFGMAASFSVARKEGRSISYRILKLSPEA